MEASAARIALGVFIAAATLAASNAAHATTWVRWKNKSQPNGNGYFLGVPGGCTPGPRGCTYTAGTGMITWGWGQAPTRTGNRSILERQRSKTGTVAP